MIYYTTAKTTTELQQILDLQQQNLAINLTAEQAAAQGFVTVLHSLHNLEQMNAQEAHVVGKDNDRVIAYLLAMTVHAKATIPVLVPMFELFDQITYHGKKITDYKYLVVGQVCVADGYRGKGVLDACYAAYRAQHSGKYELAVTEIATRNQRSLNAHKRIGFKTIYEYPAPDGEQWNIVLWDWRSAG
jgi:hypothetical protein